LIIYFLLCDFCYEAHHPQGFIFAQN